MMIVPELPAERGSTEIKLGWNMEHLVATLRSHKCSNMQHLSKYLSASSMKVPRTVSGVLTAASQPDLILWRGICVSRTDMGGPSNSVAVNAWLPQAILV